VELGRSDGLTVGDVLGTSVGDVLGTVLGCVLMVGMKEMLGLELGAGLFLDLLPFPLPFLNVSCWGAVRGAVVDVDVVSLVL